VKLLAVPLAKALLYPLSVRGVAFHGPVPREGTDIDAVVVEVLRWMRADPATLAAMAEHEPYVTETGNMEVACRAHDFHGLNGQTFGSHLLDALLGPLP
jgi:hypothetical protein